MGGSAVTVEGRGVEVEVIIPRGVGEKSKPGGGMMKGVAVMMAGVKVGTGDWTGNGCGAIFHRSHEDKRSASIKKKGIFFMI